jgi:hypothetical protein
MPAYISLVWFTDQGIRAAKETTDRLVRPLKHFHRQHDQKRKMTVLKSPLHSSYHGTNEKPSTNTQYIWPQ